MIKYLKSIIVLTSICLAIAVLMAATNMLTSPIIEQNENAAANEALLIVMPDGQGFEEIDLSSYSLPQSIKKVYKEASGGYVIELEVSGYAAGMKIMCGVDASGTVTGATCLSSGETLGYEKTYGASLTGATSDTIDSVDTVAGATKTTGGYKGAVKDALNSFVILNGGDVDIRTEEEILADNLSAALPDANGEFEEMFIVEDISGIDAVYSANNGVGYVFVIGESFFGVKADGSIVGEIGDSEKAVIDNAYILLSSSNVTEIDISAVELPKNIDWVGRTDSGNYVFELHASGFGINGDEWYNPSGEYIYISLSATADGRIISVKTTSQAETNGIGSACADKDFYSQFVGKTEADYKDIDAISGATITTNGYKTAVGRALEAIKILEGVN